MGLLCSGVVRADAGLKKIPEMSLITARGQKIQIAKYAKSQGKKNLLMVFFRTGSCGVCVQQLEEFSERIGDIHDANTALLAVSMDDAIIQARTSDKIKKAYPILMDTEGKAAKAFGVFNPAEKLAYPSIFLFDSEGKILYEHRGKSIQDRPTLQTVLQAVRHYSGQLPKRISAEGDIR